MRGAAGCLEVMLAQGADVMSTDGAGTYGRTVPGWMAGLHQLCRAGTTGPTVEAHCPQWELTVHSGAVAQ
jgi:hypothetical protein